MQMVADSKRYTNRYGDFTAPFLHMTYPILSHFDSSSASPWNPLKQTSDDDSWLLLTSLIRPPRLKEAPQSGANCQPCQSAGRCVVAGDHDHAVPKRPPCRRNHLSAEPCPERSHNNSAEKSTKTAIHVFFVLGPNLILSISISVFYQYCVDGCMCCVCGTDIYIYIVHEGVHTVMQTMHLDVFFSVGPCPCPC